MHIGSAVAIAALLALVACQPDKPTQPAARNGSQPSAGAPRAASAPLPSAPQQVVISGGVVSITDSATGKVFTFDPSTSTLQSDSISVVIDNPDLADSVFVQMLGTRVADVQIQALYAAATGTGGTRIPAMPMANVVRDSARMPIFRRFDGRHFVRPIGFGGRIGDIGIPTVFGVGIGEPSAPALPLQGVFSCTSVANAVVTQWADWTNRRAGYISNMWPKFARKAINKVLHLLDALDETIDFEQMLADSWNARVNIGLMAVVWNAYDCHNQHVQSSDTLLLGGASGTPGPIPGGGGGSSETEQCGNERWGISFDGGLHFEHFWVWVCYVEFTVEFTD